MKKFHMLEKLLVVEIVDGAVYELITTGAWGTQVSSAKANPASNVRHRNRTVNLFFITSLLGNCCFGKLRATRLAVLSYWGQDIKECLRNAGVVDERYSRWGGVLFVNSAKQAGASCPEF